jgi:DNA replication protein DnaC
VYERRPEWSTSLESILAHERELTPKERDARKVRFLEAARGERETKAREQRIELARKISDLGPRWETRRLDTYRVPPGDAHALFFASAFVNDPAPRGFWFYGDVGVGKTHLCAGTMIGCGEKGIPGTFKTAAGFLDAIKETYGRDGKIKKGEADIIAALARVPLLVLDDLDKVDFTEWASQKFYQLINARYEQNVPLLATSNCTPADLALRWSDRGLDKMIAVAIVDRLREMCQIVKVVGESYRGRAR